ncbi:MAG TPA: protein kinase [Bdellovibrionota bacterium]|nr:protein kinase [Bdellovibrionota bacterium]
MDSARALELLRSTLEFVLTRAWLHSLIQVLVLLAAGIVIYRFLMGSKGAVLRSKIPWLASMHGKREISTLIDSGEYAQAGDRLLALGQWEQAIDIFQKGNLFGRAADVYLRRRQVDKAAMFYERAGDFLKAAEIYLDRKQFDRAEANLEKAGRADEVGAIYLKHGEMDRAIKAYLRSAQWLPAARLLADTGKPLEAAETLYKAFQQAERESGGSAFVSMRPEHQEWLKEAARLYERGAKPARAAELFLEAKLPEEAARCFAKAGNAKEAAKLYEKAGDLKRAAEVLESSGDKAAAARIEGERLFQAGESLLAVGKFQESGDFSRAAEIYRDLHEMEKAAAMYERAREHALAASLYRESKKYERAAQAFERAQMWREAVESYRLANMPAQEVALLERMGDFVQAARSLHKRGLMKEALVELDRIQVGVKDHSQAMSLRGKIHLDLADPMKAKECFEESLKGLERMTSDDVDTVYNLAVVSDQTQSQTNALELIERMLAQDLVERSAVDKAQNVRKLLSDRAFTRMSKVGLIPTSGGLFAASDKALSHTSTTPLPRRYSVIKEVGRGGMGIVYTAKDTTLDRIVALKILPSSLKANEQAVKTFFREAKAAAALNHPNIVTVHDLGTQDGEYYIAMEYIEGNTLKDILKKRGKLSTKSVAEILRQLLDALKYAHSKNIVHRDLTTNNIMWTKQQTIKIMDFGLAKVIRELMSEQSIVGGTPSFMSPEQTLGRPIDHRTDLYSLGICIFEMCLGELPFKKGDLGFHHVNTPPPIPKELDPNLPDVLNQMILKCLEKDPVNRFQNAAEIQALLAKLR